MNVPDAFPYASRRMPVMAHNMVCSSHPLGVQAGIHALRDGGNAVDAALTAAITHSVVEPTQNGIGGDGFCIVWDGIQLHGLNASGKSPAAMRREDYANLGQMPELGWETVTVPGQVSGWVALWEKFGSLPFERLFAPAIHYADNGFMVTPVTAGSWRMAQDKFAKFKDFAVFLPGGQAPTAGQRFTLPDQARTLEDIAASRGESFYRGALAGKIVHAAQRGGSKLTRDDLDQHRPFWVDPIAQNYNGYTLHEIPPNGQGLASLICLGILEQCEVNQYPLDSADSIHCQIEAMKLAFADTNRYVADPDYMDIATERLLDTRYLARRAAMIDMGRAGYPQYGVPPHSGTVYLTTADASGMMVSYIQSNYGGFGSGNVVPGTGISMQNRGTGFVLEDGHPNQVGGGKRPFHTIIPAFLTRDNQPVMSFGVMGTHMQAQGHTQMVLRICDFGQNPQAAIDAPRWQVMKDNQVILEDGFSASLREDLVHRGHVLRDNNAETFRLMGGAQIILNTPDGFIGGSEPRKDGMAAGF